MNLLKRHALALLLAVLVGAGTFAVVWNSVHRVPGFAGIYKETAADESYYLARARDVLDGHPFLSNPYIAEDKNGPPLQVWLPDYLLATPLGWLSVPVQEGYLFYNLVFVALLFFLVYLLGVEVTGSRRWGIGTALFFNVGLGAARFVRIPSPGFNLIFLLLAALFSLRFLRTRRQLDLVIATLSFGLLFYLYPYFWTFWAATLGIFIVLDFFFLKDRAYRPFALSFVASFLIGGGYFWSLFAAERLPYYTETLERIGLIFTHFPSGYTEVGLGVIALAAFAIAWRRRIIPFDARSLFLASGALAGIVAVNQHLITGQNLEFSNHYLDATLFWATLALVYLAASWIRTLTCARMRTYLCALLVLVAAGVALDGAADFVHDAYAYTPADIHRQSYAPIFAWLNANTEKDDVVFTDDALSELVPVYTADDVYSADYGILFFMSDQEAEARDIINHYWDSFTPAYITANQRYIFGAEYIDEYAHDRSKNELRAFSGLPQVAYPLIPASAIARVEAEAAAIQSKPFEQVLSTYRVDYVVWDTIADPSWDLDRYPFLTKKFEANGIIVYAVSNSYPSK